MLINQNETNVTKKFGIYSSEHSNTEKRPYFVLSYIPTITLNASKLELVTGNQTTLVATTHPSGMVVTWETGNSTVVDIDATGKLTAKKAGQTTVYAHVTDTNGDEYVAQCSVYIRIVDGIYRVTNLYSANCLQATGMNILPETTVTQGDQLTIPTQSSDDISALAQLWRFAYIGSGYYSIRPYYKTDMGLFRETNNVFLNTLGTSNASDSVPLDAKWTLEWEASGYRIKGRGLNTFTLQSEKVLNSSSVFVAPNTGDFECQWRLTRITSLPSGVALYESDNGSPLVNGARAIAVEETKTLSDLNITAVVYSPSSGSQNITITVSSNATAAGVSITGTATGTTTVTVSCAGSSSSFTDSFTLNVVPLKPGVYFFKNRQNKMFADVEGPNMSSGTEIHQWEFHGGNSQRWILSYTDQGYYTISSKNSPGAFYLGVENNSQVTDTNIVLREGTPDNGMLWKIVSTSEGAFRLYPKLAESQTTPRALVATTSDDSNGDRLAYGNYVLNTSYRDEWNVILTTEYVHKILDARIYYDSSALNYLTVSEMRQSYQLAADRICQEFNVLFDVTLIEYSSNLDTPEDCYARELGDEAFCDQFCGPLEDCATTHHRGGGYLMKKDTVPGEYVCRFVGYQICLYRETEENVFVHNDELRGAGEVEGNDSVVSLSATLAYVQEELLEVSLVVQHELTHNLSGEHCIGENCTMNSVDEGWCEACKTDIRDYLCSNIYNW